MDKYRHQFKYISFRVGVIAAIVNVIFLTAAFVYLIISAKYGTPLWPLFLGAVLYAAVWTQAYMWVVKPYRRLEQDIRIFSEGYSDIHPLEQQSKLAVSPGEEQLLKRLADYMDPPKMLKMNKRQAQYLALQNQINPHFLYNTLESIRSEALIAGLDSVADMTEALARFFRYTISKVENLVSVEEELQNCMTYFRIQQYRFGSRLHLSVECDPEEQEEIYCCRLPKLTLQPILENSIIHGTECKVGTGHLVIRFERTEKRLLIFISDDGIGMDSVTLAKLNERLEQSGHMPGEEKATGGIALQNVNNRIHLLFGDEYGIHVYSMPEIGTDVEISLPILTSDRELERKGEMV